MSDLLRKYLLSTAMRFAPRDLGTGGGDPDPEDRIPEPDLDDDETVTDSTDETNPDEDSDDDSEEDPDADPEADPPRQQSRGDRTFGELRKQARETARQNAELTRQLAEMRGELTALKAPAQAAETPAQRAERLALLSPEERMQEVLNESLARHEQNNRVLQAQFMDQADKASFDAQTLANPLLKKLAPEVERRLGALRQQGQNLSRSVVATYLIGEKVMAQQGQKKPNGTRRREREQARPVRAQGDVGGGRQRQRGGDSVADIESRFGDVPI